MNALCSSGTIALVGVDQITIARYGRGQRLTIAPKGPEFIATASKLELTVHCQDPLAYDLTPVWVGFGATRVAMPLGTANVAPRTIIANTSAGAVTSRVLTYRDAGGNVLGTMTLTGSLAVGEMLDVDHGAMRIYKVDTSGVRTNAAAWLTAGYFLTLRPSDGDQLLAAYPSLELSGGETAVATYTKGWL